MKITFKKFLVEGGKAMSDYGVERATKDDIESVIEFVSETLGIDVRDNIIGSGQSTLAGKKEDSGDIDLAIPADEMEPEEANSKMMAAVNNEGVWNKGTRVGSYAVPVNEKKVQVDLMFAVNKVWAKFIYHSADGNGSAYPGIIRNILLMAAVKVKQEPGKDVLVKKDGKVIARASRSLKLDVGLERLFKMAKYDAANEVFGQTLDKVEPVELGKQIKNISGKDVKFSHEAEIISNPDDVVKWIFGADAKAENLMTVESVIAAIKSLKNSAEILELAKADFEKNSLPMPKELE